MEYKYNLGDVNITSNRPLRYPLGHILNATGSVSFKIESVVRPKNFSRVSEFYSISDNSEDLYFEVLPMKPIYFRMLVEGVRKNDTKICCNSNYYNIARGVVG